MLNLFFKETENIQDKEEETENEIDYPFQVSLPAKDIQEENSSDTSSDSSSEENLPGLLGVIAKKSKESHHLNHSEQKFSYFMDNDKYNFQDQIEKNSNFVSYIEIIQGSGIEWAIKLAKEVQSNQNISKIPSKEHAAFNQSKNFESYKFNAFSKKSPKILRNVQNEFNLEPEMGESYVSPNDSNFNDLSPFYTSKNTLSKKKKIPIDESSDDIIYYK